MNILLIPTYHPNQETIKLIKSLILNIRKPNAPIIGYFDSVEIEIERKKIC